MFRILYIVCMDYVEVVPVALARRCGVRIESIRIRYRKKSSFENWRL
jgi:hypothetical protein